MVQRGELRGGPDFCALIADGEDWEDDNVLRFAGDEPARHAMIDLLVGSGRAGGARLCLCAHGGLEGWPGLGARGGWGSGWDAAAAVSGGAWGAGEQGAHGGPELAAHPFKSLSSVLSMRRASQPQLPCLGTPPSHTNQPCPCPPLPPLQGALSLAAQPGHRGLPVGHIVAFNASHDLQLRFVRELVQTCSLGQEFCDHPVVSS